MRAGSWNSAEPETGKNKKSHKNAKHWDYYIKTIVDNKAYDVLVNVRNDVVQNDYSTKEEYVYSICFRDNKKATTSLVHTATSKATSQLDVVINSSISQSAEKSTGSAKKVSENSDKIPKSARKSGYFEAKLEEESGIEKSIGKLGEGAIESVAGRDAKVGERRASVLSRRRADMTVGQMQQMIARYTGDKVYTSKEAREIFKKC